MSGVSTSTVSFSRPHPLPLLESFPERASSGRDEDVAALERENMIDWNFVLSTASSRWWVEEGGVMTVGFVPLLALGRGCRFFVVAVPSLFCSRLPGGHGESTKSLFTVSDNLNPDGELVSDSNMAVLFEILHDHTHSHFPPYGNIVHHHNRFSKS